MLIASCEIIFMSGKATGIALMETWNSKYYDGHFTSVVLLSCMRAIIFIPKFLIGLVFQNNFTQILVNE